MISYDVIIIGAGPAGSSCSMFLHSMGHKVLVLDQADFPRDKVCGEFISPAADSILNDLEVLKSVEASSSNRLRGVAISSYGNSELELDYPIHPKTGKIPTSLSLPRFNFDRILVEKMCERGIEFLPRHRVEDILIEENRVNGVRVIGPNGRTEIKAAIVVDAGGRNAISLRKFKLKRSQKGAGKVALAAHWEDLSFPGPYCYMHISNPGYSGMAPMGDGLGNVVLILDSELVKGRDPEKLYCEILNRNPLRKEFFLKAKLISPVRIVDTLAFDVGPNLLDGLVLVGDAMGFIDPFTGEGIYLSLRSSQLAANTIHQSLMEKDYSQSFLKRYEMAREKEFSNKFLLSKILQKIIYSPALSNLVVNTISQNKNLANLLVGVIGDYIPAEEVVNYRYLFKLLRAVVGYSFNKKPMKKYSVEPT